MKILVTALVALLPAFGRAQAYYEQCEDTCNHVHGIDLSHYQGEVFWETVGENTRMAYVYLKATEGGDRIDDMYERNIQLAHRYGLKVGSYHFYRPKTDQVRQLENFKAQCLPGEQDLLPLIDIETTGGLGGEAFRDSLMKFLVLVEKAYKQKPLLYTGTNFYNRFLAHPFERGVTVGAHLVLGERHRPTLRAFLHFSCNLHAATRTRGCTVTHLVAALRTLYYCHILI